MSNDTLCIQDLNLQNFRLYSSLAMDFHPQLNVLTAPNGGGKTTILDAVAKVLAVFVLSVEEHEIYTRLLPGDVYRARSPDRSSMEPIVPTWINLSLQNHGNVLQSQLTLNTLKSRKLQFQRDDLLRMLGLTLHQQVLAFATGKSTNPPLLPLIAYYGTERLWGEGNRKHHQAAQRDDSSRFQGYRDCLIPSSSYRFFEQWFKRLSFGAWQAENGSSPSYRPEERLAAVQTAVALVLRDANWGSIKWNPVEDVLEVEHLDRGWFPIGHTSDGVTNIIGLVADIAHRCVRLNPQFGAEAAQKTPGIVLIDEVDMHLHPGWQQTILGSLQAAFPLIQFIVTTHSPQVLTTIPAECIRILQVEQGIVLAHPVPDFLTSHVRNGILESPCP